MPEPPAQTPADERAIRARLPQTWHPFFGRFGRLTDIQLRAVLPIVDGANALVSAPTAAGKTEAVLAPLIERHLSGVSVKAGRRSEPSAPRSRRAAAENAQTAPTSCITILVVAPTRALCNDLHRRLIAPMAARGLLLDLKSGDSPTLDLQHPPHLLITTPESLDSMLSRRPRMLRGVRAVVIDELHLVAQSVRGDQLRSLLTRLDHVASQPLQRCGASATTPDALGHATRFLGEGAVVIAHPVYRPRGIDADLAPATTLDDAVARILAWSHEQKLRKLLVFANTRSQVEALAALLGEADRFRGQVFAHHGSLSRPERHRVETRFLRAPSAICVATMTLELGVDIGDVDGAVLVAPPPNVASLLQRVGRANRGDARCRVLCLHQGHFERERFLHLLGCAEAGKLFGDTIPFRPTVIAQQALSLVFQTSKGWIDAGSLRARQPPDAQALYPEADHQAILQALFEKDFLRRMDHSRFARDVKLEAAYTRGQMHSLIVDTPEIEVVDETTGQSVGRVRLTAQEAKDVSRGVHVGIALGGRAHEIMRIRDSKLIVQGVDKPQDGRFIAREAPLYSYGLAQDLALHLGLPPHTLVVERLGEDWRIGHFVGTVRGVLLGWALDDVGVPAKTGPFFAESKVEPTADRLGSAEVLRSALNERLKNGWRQVARKLGAGRYAELIPPAILERWVRATLDLDAIATAFAAMRFWRPETRP